MYNVRLFRFMRLYYDIKCYEDVIRVIQVTKGYKDKNEIMTDNVTSLL